MSTTAKRGSKPRAQLAAWSITISSAASSIASNAYSCSTGKIAREIGADRLLAERAAWLAKADLLTDMVGEFPELQGVMGRYYALHDGEDYGRAASAIDAHYRPRFAGDACRKETSLVHSRLRTSWMRSPGLFGIGQQPTGDKDPFALRRATLWA